MSCNNTNAHMAQGNLDVLVFNIQGLPATETHALTYFNFLILLLLFILVCSIYMPILIFIFLPFLLKCMQE